MDNKTPEIPANELIAFYSNQANIIKYLVRRKHLAAQFPNATPEERRAADEYSKELQAMPPAQLLAMDAKAKEQDRQYLLAQEAKKEQARFFHQPSASADFLHWGQLASWPLDAGVALLLGKAPEVVTWERVKAEGMSSAFVQQFSRLRELARSHIGGLLSDPVHPVTFLRWAERYDKQIPPALREAVEKYGGNLRDWQDAYREEKQIAEQWKEAYEGRIKVLEDLYQKSRGQAETLMRDLTQRTTEAVMLAAKVKELQAQLASKTAEPAAQSTPAEAAAPGISLSRKGIEKTFDKIDSEQWRGLFNREKVNGLAECRISSKNPMYDATKVAHWIANNRPEYKLAEALRLANPTQNIDSEPEAAPRFDPHDPFKQTNRQR